LDKSLLEKLKSIFANLVKPVAIGLYLGFGFVWLTHNYYNQLDPSEQSSRVMQIVNQLVAASNDMRLRFRGERPGHPDVAILDIDNESIEAIGQWPWPRSQIASLFKEAFTSGAKVIASDIVWSEASHRREKTFYNQIKDSGQISSDLDALMQRSLLDLDEDLLFAKTMEPFSDRFIFGNVYQNEFEFHRKYINNGYITVCNDWQFKNSPEGKLWLEQDDPKLIVVDQTEAQQLPFPKELAELYQETAEFKKNPQHFCHNMFLREDSDPLWNDLNESWDNLKTDLKLEGESYGSWVKQFKESYYANQVLEVDTWLLNIEPLREVAKNNGYFNARLDSDSTIRRAQLVARYGSHYFPSIAFRAYLLATNKMAQINILPDPNWDRARGQVKGVRELQILNDEGEFEFSIPIASDGSMVINYAGPQKMFPHVRAADIIDTKKDTVTVSQRVFDDKEKRWRERTWQAPKTEFMKGKVLVAGVSAIGVYDIRVVPFPDPTYPGVETHANVIDNLLRRDFLRVNENEPPLMLIFCFILAIVLALSLSRLGAVAGMAVTLFFLTGVYLFDRFFLFSRGITAATALPALQIIAPYIILTFYKYFTEERSKRALRQTFSKYVSPQIVEEILSDPKNLELGGRKAHITVFFSDLRGFTTISEKLDPRALSDLLNSYLTPMTEIVFKNKGTLDKYMGDAIMAFFGAPIAYKEHAAFACRCALEQMAKLRIMQKEFLARGLPHIDIGIGLNTGECSVGNMGSETVRNYTVMGDAVNLASRLEGINKEYGTHIVISEFTFNEVKDQFTCREIDKVRVKGKAEPVRIFELMAEGPLPPEQEQMRQAFLKGYKLYLEMQFRDAIEAFKEAISARPEGDPTAKIYIERCEDYLSEPPPSNWDGVYVMKTK
jgi:adenylate cyclase